MRVFTAATCAALACAAFSAVAVQARPVASCTAANAALTSYGRTAAKAKAAYFKSHPKAADRAKFLAAQAAKRAKLASAVARCSSPGSGGATSTPTPAAGCSPSIGNSGYLSEGGTINHAQFPTETGTIKAAMIFVDFSDAPADASPQTYYDLLAPGAESWYASQSYGRLQFQITPALTWFRMPQPSSAYGFAGRAQTFAGQEAYIKEAVALADPTVNFSGDSYIYVVAARGSTVVYSPAWIGGTANAIQADGASLEWGATFGNDIWNNARWGWHTLAHETGHTLGLPDHYDFAFDPSNYQGQFKHVGSWSIMSWSEPAGEFFAWEKYRFGWLDPSQLRCVTSGSDTETVTPLETSGGIKAIVVQTGATTADVVEVRQLTGGDAGLCDHGVLVYRVDGSIATGHGPIELLTRGGGSSSDQCGILWDAPLDLRAGKQATYDDAQITVELLAANADGSYSIRVTKK